MKLAPVIAANDLTPFFLFGVVAVLAVVSVVWHFSRSATLLQRWAQRNGLRIVSSEYRWLARGPFFWTTSKGQSVYRIRVQEPDGTIRAGWARCGSWLAGLLSDRVDVRWDAPEPRQHGFPVVMRDDGNSGSHA